MTYIDVWSIIDHGHESMRQLATPALPCIPLLQLDYRIGVKPALTVHRWQVLTVTHRGQQD